MLPSRVGVYFALALALFPMLGYERVWDKLTAGLRGLRPRRTSEKSLRDVRRRLGAAPLKLLFETLAGPVGRPGTPGVCYRRWRTVVFDGCSSAKAADRPRVCAGWARSSTATASLSNESQSRLVHTHSFYIIKPRQCQGLRGPR